MATQKGRNWSSGDIVTAANLSSIERGVSAVAEEYTLTTWANGNIVTAAALNNIEQGIANAGGGSSDFSTAEVTFICNASNGVDVELATIEEASPPFVPVAQSNGGFELGEGDEFVASAILYKGVCSCLFPNANTLSGSGNVVIKDNKAATITGDCTITIS